MKAYIVRDLGLGKCDVRHMKRRHRKDREKMVMFSFLIEVS